MNVPFLLIVQFITIDFFSNLQHILVSLCQWINYKPWLTWCSGIRAKHQSWLFNKFVP